MRSNQSWSLVIANECPLKTDKSALFHHHEKEFHLCNWPADAANNVDAGALIQAQITIPITFGEQVEQLQNSLPSTT